MPRYQPCTSKTSAYVRQRSRLPPNSRESAKSLGKLWLMRRLRYAPQSLTCINVSYSRVIQTANLSKHLGFLRHSFNIEPSSPVPQKSPQRRARRPIINPNSIPQVPRLSRPPDVPGIHEDDEEDSSENDHNDHEPCPPEPSSPSRRKFKPKARLSASRLPLPSRVSPPPPLSALPTRPRAHVEPPRPNTSKRKPTRRQSGLLLNMNATGNTGGENDYSEMLSLPRIPSPAFGSPIRREITLEDDEEVALDDREVEVNITLNDATVDGNELDMVTRKERRKAKSRESARESEPERDPVLEFVRPRERDNKRAREDENVNATAEVVISKLKDVTNSPRSRLDLPPPESNMAGACSLIAPPDSCNAYNAFYCLMIIHRILLHLVLSRSRSTSNFGNRYRTF